MIYNLLWTCFWYFGADEKMIFCYDASYSWDVFLSRYLNSTKLWLQLVVWPLQNCLLRLRFISWSFLAILDIVYKCSAANCLVCVEENWKKSHSSSKILILRCIVNNILCVFQKVCVCICCLLGHHKNARLV